MNSIIKYKQIILYLFFGGCTTLINWATYAFCYNFAKIHNVTATIIAWVLSVAFAFITNKLWVFEEKNSSDKTLLFQVWTFTAARLLTGLLDVAIMFITVDVMKMNSSLWKLISNAIVIILNYILSKFIVFKNAKNSAD